MRLAATTLILSLALGSGLVQAAESDPPAKPAPQDESMKSSSGFSGLLIATTDEDWQQKWDTPPDTKPAFTRASTVAYGKKVTVLAFFANPALDAQGQASIRCDMRLRDPAGQVSMERKDMKCYAGPIAGSPYNVRLSEPALGFSGDPGDPAGEWAAEVVLRDAVRGVEVALRTTFTLK